MKKEMALILGILVLCSGLAAAQEQASLDETTEQEVEIMNEHIGAEIRILQLQKNLYRMTLHAQAVIDVIQDKGNDTSVLENILEEMNLLLEEAESLTTDDINQTIQAFVDIKEDAIALRKEFKETAALYLTQEDISALIQEFSEIDRTKLQEYNQKIIEKIREFNARRIERLSELLGIGSDLAERIRNREINSLEALREMKQRLQNMTQEQREQRIQEIRENVTRRSLERADAVSRAMQKRAETISQRAQERADNLSERGREVLAARQQTRADLFSKRTKNIETIRTNIRERIQNAGNATNTNSTN
jgi:predicted RNase H-related nuclease YkuK (DUF458 family)